MNLNDRLRLATRAFLLDLAAGGVRVETGDPEKVRVALNRYLGAVLDAAGHATIEAVLLAPKPANESRKPQERPWEPAYA